jgi:hypothetical protein
MARQAYIPLRNGSQRFFLIKKTAAFEKLHNDSTKFLTMLAWNGIACSIKRVKLARQTVFKMVTFGV